MIEIDAVGFHRRPGAEREEIGRWLTGHGFVLDDVRVVRFWAARAEVELYDFPATEVGPGVVTRVVDVAAGPPLVVVAEMCS